MLGSWVHRKHCDLVGVDGATTPSITYLNYFNAMTQHNIQDQIVELSDEQLVGVAGGSWPKIILEIILPPHTASSPKHRTE